MDYPQEHFDEVSSFFAVADASLLNKYQEMTGVNREIHLAKNSCEDSVTLFLAFFTYVREQIHIYVKIHTYKNFCAMNCTSVKVRM